MVTMRWVRRLVGFLGAVALLFASVGCGDDDGTTSTTTPSPGVAEDFSARGPYAVGVLETEIDADHPVVVFYPVDPDDVGTDSTPFEYTADDTWGPLVDVLPPSSIEANHIEVPDAWVEPPASHGGPFPTVVFSHALATTRFTNSLHDAHLASWGLIVAAPHHPTRDVVARLGGREDLTAQVDTVLAAAELVEEEGRRPGGPLEGAVEEGAVAVEGHSAGGREAVLAAYAEPVDGWIGLAMPAPVPDEDEGDHDVVLEGWDGYDPAAGEFDLAAFLEVTPPPEVPSLMIAADDDVLFPLADQETIAAWLSPPTRFAVLADTGHFVFTDGCPGIQEQGGLDELAEALGMDPSSQEIRTVEDGCLPDDAPVEDVVAVWNHLAVAHLRSVFGIEPEQAEASLDPAYVEATFPGRLQDYEVSP